MNFPLFEVQRLSAMALALIIAIVGHEIMHGLVAYFYKDDTAKSQNRLSVNPVRHVDLVGTIIVPAILYFTNAGFLFGWAKPVPVNMQKVIANGGYFGAINVSLAGIAYNLSLALLASFALHQMQTIEQNFLALSLFYLVNINVVLAFFNLLIIPPLDGFNAFSFLLAWLGFKKLSNKLFRYEKYGFIVLILFVATPISNYIFKPITEILKWFLL